MTTAKTNLESKLSPEALTMVKELANIIEPLIEVVHNSPQVSSNYYAEYMGILSRATENKPSGYLKLMAIAMLYVGCNPNGLNDAVKLLSN